jgi:hypothetical protein
MFRRTHTLAVAGSALALVAVPATAQASPVKLKGGATTLALSSTAAGALESLGIAAAPIGPASATKSGALAFPITRGRITGKAANGTIHHAGGIRLSKGSTKVALRSFTIHIDNHPDLTARVGDARVAILKLDLSNAKFRLHGKRVTVGRVKATLTGAAAKALNGAFSTTAFKKGLDVGTATIRTRAVG